MHRCPVKHLREHLIADVKAVFYANSIEMAHQYLKMVCDKWESVDQRLSSWLEESIPEGFTFFQYPRNHWRKLRANNVSERLNREIRRRTSVAGLFPNSDSLLRLCTAVLVEIS